MKVLIVGGSNSILKDRYILHFANKLTEEYGPVEFVNCSVGATTSITSLALIDLVTIRPDLIVFEYSLNDTGHLNHLADAYEKKWQMLEIFFDFVGQKFPGVPVLPLMLSSQDFFDISVPNNVYDAETDFYQQRNIRFHDMRVELYEMFCGSLPEFVYADKSHFHRGFASALIGRTLAQVAKLVLSNGKADNFYANPLGKRARITHARALAAANNAPLEQVANRYLNVELVQVGRGDVLGIQTPGWPICLYIASDLLHGDFCLDVNGLRIDVATIHQDSQFGKFVFTSIPLFLNDQYMALRRDGPVTLKFSMKDGGDVWAFDCMEPEPVGNFTRRVRLSAIAWEHKSIKPVAKPQSTLNRVLSKVFPA